MTAAISFDGHWPADEKPIGIDVATRQFIRAHFRYAQQDKFYCVCPNETAAKLYRKFAAEENIAAERCISINQNDAMALETADCLIRYDPGIIKHAWARRYHGEIAIVYAASPTPVRPTPLWTCSGSISQHLCTHGMPSFARVRQ